MPDEESGIHSYLTEKAPNLRVIIYLFLRMQVSHPSGCPASPITNVHYSSSHIPAAHPKYWQSSHYERCNHTTEKHLKSPGLVGLHHNIYSYQGHASKQNKTKKIIASLPFTSIAKLEIKIERQGTLKGLWKGTKLLVSESDWSLPEAESQEFQLDLCPLT